MERLGESWRARDYTWGRALMRAWVIGIGLVLLACPPWAVATSHDRSGTAEGQRIVAGSETSGIEGQVSIRPVRPVERKGVPNARPYQARITVLDPAGREVAAIDSAGVAAVRSDASLTRVELETDDLRMPLIDAVLLILRRVPERAVVGRVQGQSAIVAPAVRGLLGAFAGCGAHALLGR